MARKQRHQISGRYVIGNNITRQQCRTEAGDHRLAQCQCAVRRKRPDDFHRRGTARPLETPEPIVRQRASRAAGRESAPDRPELSAGLHGSEATAPHTPPNPWQRSAFRPAMRCAPARIATPDRTRACRNRSAETTRSPESIAHAASAGSRANAMIASARCSAPNDFGAAIRKFPEGSAGVSISARSCPSISRNNRSQNAR